MKFEADIEAEISLLSTEDGGRSTCVSSGYRPNHLIKDDYLTSGSHMYLDKNKVNPGGKANAAISFCAPENYPHSLWVGRIINIQEGGRIIGYMKVTRIMNKLLENGS